jgi:hypothetical protein
MTDISSNMKAIVDFETLMRGYPVDGWIVARTYYRVHGSLMVNSVVCHHETEGYQLYFPEETNPGWRIKVFDTKEEAENTIIGNGWMYMTIMRFPEMRQSVLTKWFVEYWRENDINRRSV